MKPNPTALLRSIPPIRRAFAAISIVLSLVFALAASGALQGTSWTYQGQLRRSGAAYTGTCNFQFSLWDAASAGTQTTGTYSLTGVSVVNGLFTVVLDFSGEFKGDARWLATNVQCSGDGGFTQLDPRQAITAAPYALSLRPGASITDNTDDRAALTGQNLSPIGYGLAGIGDVGVLGQSLLNSGVGVNGITSGFNASGVNGSASGQEGFGVKGNSNHLTTGAGVYGTGFTGVRGVSNGNSNSTGVRGDATGTTSVGLYGTASGTNSIAVLGITSTSTGVYGQSSGSGTAIYGQALGAGLAGSFAGPVNIQGTLTKSAGSFRIDHPLDPANKFLSHSFVESPEMMNIYNGNVTTDASGHVTVSLPDYFGALNRDYRYQLTVIGPFAQASISREVAQNSFEIQTDKPGVKVSWQVTGIRQDAYAKAHPIVVEKFKPSEERGLYLYPAGFGAGEEKRIGHLQGPAPALGAQDSPATGQSDQAR